MRKEQYFIGIDSRKVGKSKKDGFRMGKLVLTGRNLGCVFNSRRERACACQEGTLVTKTA